MAKQTPVSLLVVAAFLAGITFASAGINWLGLSSWFSGAEASLGEGTTRLEREVNTIEEAFVMVAERVNPTVVQIRSERVNRNAMRDPFGGGDPFQGTPFEGFFGPPQGQGRQAPREQRSYGLGSGVIVREDGYILTNNHVVEGADGLRVRLFSGEEFDATVVGTDPTSDLAVIRIQRSDLPVISLGNIERVRTGQMVMAFGSPLSEDLSNTVTSGIVSAVGRFSADQRMGPVGFIQTDAAINPGNSGGPLVNLSGELVGLNNAIFTRTGGFQGIGFAIPVDVVRNVMEQLITSGNVRRAQLGVNISAVPEALARALNIPRGAAQVGSVVPGSAAERAGLREGDIILAVDGVELTDWRALTQSIQNRRPGEEVRLTYLRDDERRTLTVTLGELQTTASAGGTAGSASPEAKPEEERQAARFTETLGFTYVNFSTLSAADRQRFRLPSSLNRTGVFITDVDPGSAAFRDSGIRAGYFITHVNNTEVTSLSAFEQAYERILSGADFQLRLLLVQPDGATSTLRTALTKP